MGINRDSRHKKRLTGGRMPIHKKKRAFEKARPVSNTKLDLSTGKVDKRVRHVRVRGGNYKFRALRLKEGNFNWASESVTKKARIINVVYNASNNELVRTNTLVKNCIVIIDATPFKAWYSNHYGVEVGPVKQGKGKKQTTAETQPKVAETKKRSKHVLATIAGRQKERKIDSKVEEQFGQQRLLACISSRPGQCGRADGYILEGKELEFYARKLDQKRKS